MEGCAQRENARGYSNDLYTKTFAWVHDPATQALIVLLRVLMLSSTAPVKLTDISHWGASKTATFIHLRRAKNLFSSLG